MVRQIASLKASLRVFATKQRRSCGSWRHKKQSPAVNDYQHSKPKKKRKQQIAEQHIAPRTPEDPDPEDYCKIEVEVLAYSAAADDHAHASIPAQARKPLPLCHCPSLGCSVFWLQGWRIPWSPRGISVDRVLHCLPFSGCFFALLKIHRYTLAFLSVDVFLHF